MEIYEKRNEFTLRFFRKKKERNLPSGLLNILVKQFNILQTIFFVKYFLMEKKESSLDIITENMQLFFLNSEKKFLEIILVKTLGQNCSILYLFKFQDILSKLLNLKKIKKDGISMNNELKKDNLEHIKLKKNFFNDRIRFQKNFTNRQKNNFLFEDLSRINTLISNKIVNLTSLLNFQSNKQLAILEEINDDSRENFRKVDQSGKRLSLLEKKKKKNFLTYVLIISIFSNLIIIFGF
jgi:hypothetical protein